jgi:hypothetical protein
VRAFDQARAQRGGQDADESLASFEGLVAGRWSIVQNFESDGRRYLVAIQNQPGQIAAAALSPNEAHSLLLRAQGLTNKLMHVPTQALNDASLAELVARLYRLK